MGLPVEMAYASTAPSTAPPTAVTADSTTDCSRADVTAGSPRARRLPNVGRPSLRKAPITTTSAGMTRKAVT